MHRQAPLAMGALAACAVIATGAVLLREQVLTFASWPDATRDGPQTPDVVIPHVRAAAPRSALPTTAAALGLDRSHGATTGRGLTLFAPAAAGGRLTLGPMRPAVLPSAAGPFTAPAPAPAAGPNVTATGPGASSNGSAPAQGPLSGYDDTLPVAGDPAPVAGATQPATKPNVFLPTPGTARVAVPEMASVAPAADPSPVVSSVDNAPPPPDPTGTKPPPVSTPAPTTPDPTPDPPSPSPPADPPTPAPAESTPPADPAPPSDPAPQAPTDQAPTAPSGPAPTPAPADPAPPADPDPATQTIAGTPGEGVQQSEPPAPAVSSS